jgi:hypothetical protein
MNKLCENISTRRNLGVKKPAQGRLVVALLEKVMCSVENLRLDCLLTYQRWQAHNLEVFAASMGMCPFCLSPTHIPEKIQKGPSKDNRSGEGSPIGEDSPSGSFRERLQAQWDAG